jgi:hypothetical protein
MLFWTDIWIDQPLKDKFPQLYSFTRKPKYSVRFFLNNQLDRIFSPLPLPLLAANQLAEAQNLIQSSTWDTKAYDSWLYSWGSSKHSNKKVYNILIGTNPVSPLFKWLWASRNLGN